MWGGFQKWVTQQSGFRLVSFAMPCPISPAPTTAIFLMCSAGIGWHLRLVWPEDTRSVARRAQDGQAPDLAELGQLLQVQVPEVSPRVDGAALTGARVVLLEHASVARPARPRRASQARETERGQAGRARDAGDQLNRAISPERPDRA